MTLDKVILYNYGPFTGRHEIDLSPKEGEKNIILIGGLNGSGKTSLLNAIQLGFFGKLAIKKVKGSGTYKLIIQENFNTVSDDRSTYVEVFFQAEYQSRNQKFRIVRQWNELKNGYSEDFSVYNGMVDPVLNTKLSENWEDYMDQFFPFNISDLFLFDGEKIEQIASHENSNEYIKDSIKSLFGLDILDSTFSDLKILEKRIYEEIDKIVKDPKYHNALSSLKEREKELGSRIVEKNEIQEQIEELENTIYVQKQNLKAVGGDLYNQKDSLEEEEKVFVKEKEEAVNEISQYMNANLPFLFVQPLLHEIVFDGQNNYAEGEIKLLEKKLSEQEDKILQILSDSGTEASALNDLKQKLKDSHSSKNFPEFRIIEDRAVTYDARKLLDTCEDAREEFRRKGSSYKQIDEKLFDIKSRLNTIPSSEKVEPELNKLNQLLDEQQALSIKKEYVEEQIEELKKKCKELNDQVLMFSYDGSSDGTTSLVFKKRIVQKIEAIRPLIAKFDQEMVRKRISKIENLTLDSINQLLRKKDFIKDFSIDPESFELQLVNDFNELVNLDQLSAGERQILATSLLWGMAKASKQMLPLVIDTPLGRLDSKHRVNLIKNYFPEGSHQVILLSTDQEISGTFYKDLRKHVAKEYAIQYNSKKKTSEIVKGYPFKEALNESA